MWASRGIVWDLLRAGRRGRPASEKSTHERTNGVCCCRIRLKSMRALTEATLPQLRIQCFHKPFHPGGPGIVLVEARCDILSRLRFAKCRCRASLKTHSQLWLRRVEIRKARLKVSPVSPRTGTAESAAEKNGLVEVFGNRTRRKSGEFFGVAAGGSRRQGG